MAPRPSSDVSRVDGFEPIRAIGAGRDADVFLYRQALSEREVVVKILSGDDVASAAFRVEAGRHRLPAPLPDETTVENCPDEDTPRYRT